MGNTETKPRWIYRKTATYLNTVIVCAFVLGPIVFFILGSIKPQGLEWFICVLGIVILAIIIIVCLASAISNYMLAKDAERDDILEKIEQLNRNIEWFNESQVQLLERLRQGEPKQ